MIAFHDLRVNAEKRNAKGLRKNRSCAEKGTWMREDSGRALDRVDIAESRLEETGTDRWERKREKKDRKRIESESSGRAETS